MQKTFERLVMQKSFERQRDGARGSLASLPFSSPHIWSAASFLSLIFCRLEELVSDDIPFVPVRVAVEAVFGFSGNQFKFQVH